MAPSSACDTSGERDARGMNARADAQPQRVTLRCCSGRASTDARGMQRRAEKQLQEGNWRCCSGRAPTNARGINTCASRQLEEGIWRCCSGRAPTDARVGFTHIQIGSPSRPPGGGAVNRVLDCVNVNHISYKQRTLPSLVAPPEFVPRLTTRLTTVGSLC